MITVSNDSASNASISWLEWFARQVRAESDVGDVQQGYSSG
jgi:hypothetical protein